MHTILFVGGDFYLEEFLEEIAQPTLTEDVLREGGRQCLRELKERKALEERLQCAEKMAALGQLLCGAAHGLNNALGSASLYSELLQEKMAEGNPLRDHAAQIFISIEKASAIIQDLLCLSGRDHPALRMVNLNDVVSASLSSPEFAKTRALHPHVTFKTRYDRGLLNIMGSPAQVQKAVINLVSNAAEAISGKGEVTIGTGSRYLDGPISGYEDVNKGSYAVLTVSDTGMGIPDKDKGKIFEPFFTKGTPGRSGTGLGMAIVRETVKDHHGYIDVRTWVGKGTTFTLYFPAAGGTDGETAKGAC